jgi:hypothetical protein
VIDGIAFTILELDSHVVRRLILHNSPPTLNLTTIRTTQSEANRLNNESRLTFALIADLTTFIHVADLLRVDFRHDHPRVALIELKAGRINNILLEQLKDYEPDQISIDRLRHDSKIASSHRKQAERMLRQQIRLKQIREVLTRDEGIDIQLNCPIKLLGPTTALDSYDHYLNELCDEAVKDGMAAATLESYLHLGVAYDEDHDLSRLRAEQITIFAAVSATAQGPDELSSIRQELAQVLKPAQGFKVWNLLNANLRGMSDLPFVLWGIASTHKVALVDRRLTVTAIFDLAGFIFLARQLGIAAELTTRKEAEELAQELPRHYFPRWGNRVLRLHAPGYSSIIMLGGIMHRMINDLHSPSHVLKICTRTPEGFIDI